MNTVNIDKVLEILQRDHPMILERAMLVARLEDLEAENAALKASQEEAQDEVD